MGRFGSMFKKSDEKGKPDDTKPQANPYASNPYANNPYAQQPSGRDTYTQAASSANQNGLPSGPRSGLPSGPRAGRQVPSQNTYYGDSPTGSDSTAPPPYSSGSSRASTQSTASTAPSGTYGYGNDKLGAAGGYGGRRFEEPSGTPERQGPPPQRQGGYGGLGGGQRDALFGSRPNGPPVTRPVQEEPTPVPDWRANQHNMTEQEIEDAQARDGKKELNDLRNKTEWALDQMIGDLQGANASADATNQSLARQREMLQSTRMALNEANVQNRIATANVKDLKDANKSMFNFVAASRNRREKMDEQRMADTLREKDERDRLRQEIRESEKARRMQKTDAAPTAPFPKSDRSRFTFEDDDGEQEAGEARIEEKQEVVYNYLKDLQTKVKATSEEVDSQSSLLQDVGDRIDTAHRGVIRNHAGIAQWSK